MSQIEQEFRLFLSKNPEVESCYQEGLINRRSLARYLIKQGIAKSNQVDAVIAMLRRFQFKEISKKNKDIFKGIKTQVKDNIIIFDFEKEKELVRKLDKLIANTDYDKGDTLKIVVGSGSVKLFIDEKNEAKVKDLLKMFKVKNKYKNISEISLMFDDKVVDAKGILCSVTKELAVNDVFITELLTASPELLIYLKEEFVVKAYEVLKRMQK
ncbi:hypothetical protein HOC35_00320 [Candidatus Woesearchaeota archaeon]|jgi:hypothetical protein|nr:hypothetical protein [Candidatus Woesearchaeota archaeon]